MNDQLNIQFDAVPVKRMPTERTRDSEGRYASAPASITDPIAFLKNENEMLTRKYLAVAKQLASTERELLKYKQI